MRERTTLIMLLAIALAILVAGCGPDPVKVAKGEAIKAEARQDERDRRQTREQQQEEWEGTLPDRLETYNRLYRTLGIAFAVSGSVLLAVAAGAGAYAVVGVARARVRAVSRSSELVQIKLDPVTSQYPLVAYRAGSSGPVRIYNPNTNAVCGLDELQAPDRAMITASGAVQLAGVAGRHAAIAAGRASRGDGAGAATGIAAGASRPVLVAYPLSDEGGEG